MHNRPGGFKLTTPARDRFGHNRHVIIPGKAQVVAKGPTSTAIDQRKVDAGPDHHSQCGIQTSLDQPTSYDFTATNHGESFRSRQRSKESNATRSDLRIKQTDDQRPVGRHPRRGRRPHSPRMNQINVLFVGKPGHGRGTEHGQARPGGKYRHRLVTETRRRSGGSDHSQAVGIVIPWQPIGELGGTDPLLPSHRSVEQVTYMGHYSRSKSPRRWSWKSLAISTANRWANSLTNAFRVF